MKRFGSEKKGALYLPTTLKKREITNSSLESGAGAGFYDMKKEDKAHEIKPCSILTLSREEKTLMSKLIKEMASLCSFCNMNIRNLSEQHDIGVREDLSANVYFVLAERLYNVWRDQKDYHEKYDLFSSNDMKDLANVMEETMHLGAQKQC